MSDLGLTWSNEALAADIAVSADDLVTDAGLRTAVLLSLFTDADDDESGEHRGWWGDGVPSVEGDRFGSRLWKLDRAKPTGDTLTQAEDYAREALRWVIDDKVASKVDAVASFVRPPAAPALALSLEITIHRPDVDPVKFRFGVAWDAEARKS